MSIVRNIRARIELARLYTLHRRSLRAIRKWQMSHLQTLLRNAGTRIPLYRKLLQDLSIDPLSIRRLEDMGRLPIIAKEAFVGKATDEYVDNTRPLWDRWKSTSGTTGKPFTFISGFSSDPGYSDFTCFRFLLWDGGKSMRTIERADIARIKMTNDPRAHRLFVATRELLADPRASIKKIAAFDPIVIEGFASVLLEMARCLAADPSLPRLAPRYVVLYGEVLSPTVRRFLSDTLETEVYDRYGLEETGVVGLECRLHDGFHISCEALIVEVVDDDGAAVPDGTHGRILLTDLTNFNMPFIRYDTRDEGVLTSEPCGCGMHSPRLWVKGRRHVTYLTFGGKRFIPLEFDVILGKFMNSLLQYQVAKLTETVLTVRVIPGPAFSTNVPEEIRQKVAALVGDAVQISIDEVSAIARLPNGKSPAVVDESVDASV